MMSSLRLIKFARSAKHACERTPQVRSTFRYTRTMIDAMTSNRSTRAYIRHPSGIPIRIVSTTVGGEGHPALNDVSFGGLSCGGFRKYLEPGTVISVKIPLVKPPFKAHGKVVWCHPHADGYDLGVEFMDADDAYRAHMVEQVCYIEEYRQRVRTLEGRELSAAQAAHEWIGRFAADFPNPAPRGNN